jgi:hypothetical protein
MGTSQFTIDDSQFTLENSSLSPTLPVSPHGAASISSGFASRPKSRISK